MTATTAPVLETFGAAFLRLFQLRRDVGDSEWRAGATPKPVDDTTERASGSVSDPTARIFLDTRRVHLRESMIESERALATGLATMQVAVAKLEAVLARG